MKTQKLITYKILTKTKILTCKMINKMTSTVQLIITTNTDIKRIKKSPCLRPCPRPYPCSCPCGCPCSCYVPVYARIVPASRDNFYCLTVVFFDHVVTFNAYFARK